MGVIVLFRRSSNHDVSFGDRLDALRMVGRSEGQLSPAGVYPLGALGRARLRRVAKATVVSKSIGESRRRTDAAKFSRRAE